MLNDRPMLITFGLWPAEYYNGLTDFSFSPFSTAMECKSPQTSSNTGLIVGVTVGAVFLVVFLVAALLIAVVRQHRKSQSEDLKGIINN